MLCGARIGGKVAKGERATLCEESEGRAGRDRGGRRPVVEREDKGGRGMRK